MGISKSFNLIKTKIATSSFLAASFVVALSTLIKILSIFAITKYLSVKFGPETLGIYGQSQSFINLIIAFSTLSSSVGITKYLAEYKNQPILRSKIAIAAWDLTFVCSFVVSFIIVICSSYISRKIFFSAKYIPYVIFIGTTTFFISAYKTKIAILNGYHEFKKIGTWEILFNIGSCLFLILATLLVENSVVVSISIVYVFFFWFMNKRPKLELLKIFERLRNLKNVITPLTKYSTLIFIQMVLGYGVEIVLRSLLVDIMSLKDLGLYEGMNKISGAILLPVTSIISIYFLPLFANKTENRFNDVLFSTFKKVIPFVLIMLILLFYFRVLIIKSILSSDFLVIEHYVYIQIIGLFFSVINLIYLNAFLGRGFIKLIFMLSTTFSIWFLILCYLLIPQYGLMGAFISYLVSSMTGALLYSIVHILKSKKLNSIKYDQ